MTAPQKSLTAFLAEILDERLAALPDDRARVVFLAKQNGQWKLWYEDFRRSGRCPVRDTEFPPISAADFVVHLSHIAGLIAKYQKQRVAA